MKESTRILSVLVIISSFILIYFLFFKNKLIRVKSSINDKYFWVQNKPDAQEASDVLARLDNKIEKLIDYLWIHKDSRYKYMNKYIYRLKSKYSYEKISENDNSSYTSYSLNKKYIVFCIRQRINGQDLGFVPENVLMYVALHELSHFIADKTISESEHQTDEEFRTLFSSLIKASHETKVYNPINFKDTPEAYCGLTIN